MSKVAKNGRSHPLSLNGARPEIETQEEDDGRMKSNKLRCQIPKLLFLLPEDD
ncbi:hypothetical protein ACLOJK_015213 [Asimina triloba]